MAVTAAATDVSYQRTMGPGEMKENDDRKKRREQKLKTATKTKLHYEGRAGQNGRAVMNWCE